jgi:pimeloyl-ACP methyl ester carboxylesterase
MCLPMTRTSWCRCGPLSSKISRDQITCPVLVLRGANSDVLLPKTVEEMKRRGPPVEVVEFAGVGHAPMLLDRAQIDPVRRFLLE